MPAHEKKKIPYKARIRHQDTYQRACLEAVDKKI
jgi:hypothetical protein